MQRSNSETCQGIPHPTIYNCKSVRERLGILNDQLLLHTRPKVFDKKNSNCIWIVLLIGGFEILRGTSRIRTNGSNKIRIIFKPCPRVLSQVFTTRLETKLPFVDCVVRHTSCGDHFVNHPGEFYSMALTQSTHSSTSSISCNGSSATDFFIFKWKVQQYMEQTQYVPGHWSFFRSAQHRTLPSANSWGIWKINASTLDWNWWLDVMEHQHRKAICEIGSNSNASETWEQHKLFLQNATPAHIDFKNINRTSWQFEKSSLEVVKVSRTVERSYSLTPATGKLKVYSK